MLKLGSGISWCPLGSPGEVVGAGIGWRPSWVEVMPEGRGVEVGEAFVVVLRDGRVGKGGRSSVVGGLVEVFREGMMPGGIDGGESVGVAVGGSGEGSSVGGRNDGVVVGGRGADGIMAVGFLEEGIGAEGIRAMGFLDDRMGAEGIKAMGFLVDDVGAEGITSVPNAHVTPWSEPILKREMVVWRSTHWEQMGSKLFRLLLSVLRQPFPLQPTQMHHDLNYVLGSP